MGVYPARNQKVPGAVERRSGLLVMASQEPTQAHAHAQAQGKPPQARGTPEWRPHVSEVACRFFRKGKCKNGEACRFYHPTDPEEVKALKTDWQRGKDARRAQHPPQKQKLPARNSPRPARPGRDRKPMYKASVTQDAGATFPFKVKGQEGAIPQFGLGTATLQGTKCVRAVHAALKAGYRLLDTALLYGCVAPYRPSRRHSAFGSLARATRRAPSLHDHLQESGGGGPRRPQERSPA